jgi:pimeloyl-ACP methyl ester carboxylesterase
VTYEAFDVPVMGGRLRVGRWGSGDGPIVLAAHGITGTHVQLHAIADQLGPDVTLVAPDLRGRGRSSDIDGPFSMGAHADDLTAVLDHLEIERAVVMGHSMGGFAAVVLADRQPQRVQHLVLVDGGLPLDLGPLADLPTDQVLAAMIGPALERLRMTFESVDAYFDHWRPHPALARDWNHYIEAAYEYDLGGEAPALRSTVREVAVLADAESELVHDDVERALERLATPAVLVRAERGILDQEPPLYPDAAVQPWLDRLPTLRTVLVEGVNHYTIALTERGAKAVAEVTRQALAS